MTLPASTSLRTHRLLQPTTRAPIAVHSTIPMTWKVPGEVSVQFVTEHTIIACHPPNTLLPTASPGLSIPATILTFPAHLMGPFLPILPGLVTPSTLPTFPPRWLPRTLPTLSIKECSTSTHGLLTLHQDVD